MKIFGSLLLTLSLSLPCTVLVAVDALAEPSARQEVTERLELNNVTPDQLVATGAVDAGLARKIVQLREELGGFQSYDDLKELEIPDEQLKQLQFNTTIQGIAADCNC